MRIQKTNKYGYGTHESKPGGYIKIEVPMIISNEHGVKLCVTQHIEINIIDVKLDKTMVYTVKEWGVFVEEEELNKSSNFQTVEYPTEINNN